MVVCLKKMAWGSQYFDYNEELQDAVIGRLESKAAESSE